MARASLSHCEATFFYRALAFSGFLWGEVRVNSNMVEFTKWLLCLQFLILYFHTLNHLSPLQTHFFLKDWTTNLATLLQAMSCLWWDMDGSSQSRMFCSLGIYQVVHSAMISTACRRLVLDFLIGWNTCLRSNPESWGSNWNMSHGNHGKSLFCNLMFASFTDFLPLFISQWRSCSDTSTIKYFPFLSLLISLVRILIRH